MSVFLCFRRRRLRGLSGDASAGGMLDSARLEEYAAFTYPNTAQFKDTTVYEDYG